ncbi:hypothetical protein N0V93_000242 [Gnomoniopsis smithogilvyi]|uniref:Major facilitator superfamily (MFS) profile domain-containing protein n=1 Tax=Gnomoniopsis smithogilvyi TaxID=1191159 RepID=A0A9W8YZB4_9PEZI|nr:hypothetical protein N0V93_000242 [Gnomoniopsis smithogilvyi]
MRISTSDDVKMDGAEVVMDEEKRAATPWDAETEKRLRWKCDRHVLPCITLLFFLSFLDRTNIGNAKIQGMIEELHMTGHDYNIALFVFFPAYILFEVPSNIIIKRIAPSTWLSIIMVCWGIATVCQGLVRNVEGLIACRFFLGLFEAGVFPGCIYLISMYYTRFELQWRLSLFFSASILAGAISGLLAYAIANMGGVGGYEAWRWIFIIEGLATIIIGAASKYFTVDWPETAKFLTDEERRLLIAKLSQDNGDSRMDHLDKRAAKRVFTDWKIYCAILMYLGIVNTGYSGSFFIPSIIQELGYQAQEAQARSVPIYVVAAVLCLMTAYLTDRLRHRYAFCMAGVIIASVGYIILLCQQRVSAGVEYFALFLIVSGGYITQPVTLAWLSNNVSGHYKRSIASAMQVGFGNCGGIVASNIFWRPSNPCIARDMGPAWL